MITECSLIENLTYIQLLGILCKDILYKLLYKTVRILWSNFLKTVNLSMVEESLRAIKEHLWKSWLGFLKCCRGSLMGQHRLLCRYSELSKYHEHWSSPYLSVASISRFLNLEGMRRPWDGSEETQKMIIWLEVSPMRKGWENERLTGNLITLQKTWMDPLLGMVTSYFPAPLILDQEKNSFKLKQGLVA